MCATAANLSENVLPAVALRQWVLTFPFAWRRRLAPDRALFGALSRIFAQTVQAFYTERAATHGAPGAKTGAVTAAQRTSSHLRLVRQQCLDDRRPGGLHRLRIASVPGSVLLPRGCGVCCCIEDAAIFLPRQKGHQVRATSGSGSWP
jgi:hypothetical protein